MLNLDIYMSLLQSTLNTRDLGGKRNKNGQITISNRLFRSDYNDNLFQNQNDINFLISNQITTIIDMRTNEEKKSKNNYLESLKYFKYYNYPIEEGSQIPKTIKDVPNSYMEIACSKNIKYILETIANSESGVLFFCSAGKDRTGVVTTIIYMLCDVLEEEIIKDYMISKDKLKILFETVKQNNPNIDINIIIPNESYIRIFMKMFYDKFGEANKYLEFIGLSIEERIMLKNKLLKP